METAMAGSERVPATTPVLRTLVLADLVESTALTEQLGDIRAIEIFRKHDRMGRDLVARHGGREIDKTDGFLVLFDRPIRAIAFALDYQRALRTLGRGEGVPLSARVGIHVGDVLAWENSPEDVLQGAKPIEVEGLVKPIAARLMGLALPGQVLMTGVAHTLAQRGREELGERASSVRFKYHGRYEFKGVAEALPVFEAGEEGIAPLKRPPSGAKAWREVPIWRRPRALLAEAALAILAAVALFWFFGHPEPAIAFAARDWVVIGDLRNLTSERNFDAGLDAALRISLEQSRFVNLVSDLQVRDALKRMTKPAGTPIDRAIGSEIALREGARALIIPTVAEVGGRIRVSAEVVDPHTQATVYAQSADGSGPSSALVSVDKVTRELRGKLGEAMSSIESDAVPLPKATTENLEALRAYALGRRAYYEGQWGEGLSLLQQAVTLDPNFATARLLIGAIHYGADDRIAMMAELERVAPLRERLAPRDALYYDALRAMVGATEPALEKWKLLSNLYPDHYGALYNYALTGWIEANRYEPGIASLEKGLSEHNYARGAFHYLLATLYLGLERFEDAARHLEQAQALRGDSLGLVHVDAAAAARHFDDAQRRLDAFKSSGSVSNDLSRHVSIIAVLVDRGRWADALAAADAAVQDARAVGPYYERAYIGTRLSLLQKSEKKERLQQQLTRYVETEHAASADASDANRDHAIFASLFGAYLAAAVGLDSLADRATAANASVARNSGIPVLANMAAIAEAERDRRQGKPAAAIERLAPFVDGAELFLTHVVLLRACADAGRVDDALAHARWLETHRGRAYAEYGASQMLRSINVLESNLAPIAAAEVLHAAGREKEAAEARASAESLWPSATRPAFVDARLRALASP
jgi:putative peptide modification system cyclase